MHVISASRRTDIPAFYMPWFMNRLRAGRASYPNPFGGQMHEVSLLPDDVHSIVFWTKNPAPLLRHVPDLHAAGYRFYTHVTIIGAPRTIEPHVPRWTQTAASVRTLAALTSPLHVQWRYDPIVMTPDLTPDYHADRFAQIAAALAGSTTRCYVSFATFYNKVARQMQHPPVNACDSPRDEKRALFDRLAGIAERFDITLYACCQDALVSDRVMKAHCVDADLLATLFPDRPLVPAARPTRAECGCASSRDIGMYDTCPYGCIYCYANGGHARAVTRHQQHDPDAATLIPSLRDA